MIHRNPLYVDPLMELLNPVIDALMDKEARRLDDVLNDLLIRNYALGGTMNAFVHGGEIYHLVRRRFVTAEKILPIHPSLSGDAEDLRTLRERVARDRKRLHQALTVVVPRCRTKQDIRDVLPEPLVATIPMFRGMERQRPEGFLLDQNPLLRGQYEKAVSLALFYQGLQLIY